MKKIFLNDQLLRAYDIEESTFNHEVTKNELLKLKIIAHSYHNEEADFNDLGFDLKNNINVVIPSEDKSFIANCLQNTISQNGNQSTITIELEEVDENIDPDHNREAAHLMNTIVNDAKIAALSQILIEKGIITREEVENRLNDIYKKRETEKINEIVYGLRKKVESE